VADINRHGNLIKAFDVPCSTYGKTTEQAKAIIGDACRTVTDYAAEKQKNLVLETLDFSKKKRQLDNEPGRYARMLSSLPYNKIKETLCSQSHNNTVAVYTVNPAYLSLIGRFKFALQKRRSVHQAAAFVLARRF